MKNVNESFKENIKKYGRMLDSKITVGEKIIRKENINSIVSSFNTSLFKSVMFGIEIDSNIEIEKNAKINLEIGVKYNTGAYEYINFGEFTVYSLEKQEDTESYKIIAYDKMLDSMIDFDLEVSESKTVREYLLLIFNRLGWNITGIPSTFINSNKIIESYTHYNINYTFRDVLDEIATVAGSFIYVKDGIPTLGYITETEEIINEEYLSENDVTVGEKYLINALVFSRSEDSDTIYRQDGESITTNGLYEFKIFNNQIVNSNNRSDFIDDLFNYLKTLEFYIYDIKSTGIMWFEICDRFTLNIKGNNYSTIILNDELTIEQDMEESLYVDKPIESETEYKHSDDTDKKINQTTLIVNKQEQKIQSLITQVGNRSQKETSITQDIESIESKVIDIEDVTNTIYGAKTIILENCIAGNLLELHIYGNNSVFKYLYPSDNLYPSDDLYPMGDSRIIVNSTLYELGILDVLRSNSEIKDEFILKDGKVQIIRRVETDGVTKIVEEIEDLGELEIPLKTGTNTITIKNYSAIIKAKFAIKNSYTDVFATKVEMNSTITQTAEEINLEVSKKVDENEIISKINQTASEIQIQANKLNLSANDVLNILAGNTINLSTKNLNISSNSFNVDSNGNVTLKASGTKVLKVEDVSNSSKKVYITEEAVVIDSAFQLNRVSMGIMNDTDGYVAVRNGDSGYTSISGSGITTPSVTQTSLEATKKNFEKLKNALDIIKATEIYKYNLKTQTNDEKKHIGFVIGKNYNYSSEITAVDNGKEVGVDTYSMISVAYKAIQELSKKIEELENKING